MCKVTNVRGPGKYDVDYKGNRKQALKDYREYVGEKAWKTLTDYLEENPTLDQFQLVSSFAGVRGYPARVLWEQHQLEGERIVADAFAEALAQLECLVTVATPELLPEYQSAYKQLEDLLKTIEKKLTE